MVSAIRSRDLFLCTFLRDRLARPKIGESVSSELFIGEAEENAAYALAHRLFQERDLAAALKLFSLLRLLRPTKALYGIAIAVTLFEGKNFFDAALHYLEAYLAQPERPELALWTAWSLIQDGKGAMAASLLRVVLTLRPLGKDGAGEVWERMRALLAQAEREEDKEQAWESFWGQSGRNAGGKRSKQPPAPQLYCVVDYYGGENLSVLVGRILAEGLAVLRSEANPRPPSK